MIPNTFLSNTKMLHEVTIGTYPFCGITTPTVTLSPNIIIKYVIPFIHEKKENIRISKEEWNCRGVFPRNYFYRINQSAANAYDS